MSIPEHPHKKPQIFENDFIRQLKFLYSSKHTASKVDRAEKWKVDRVLRKCKRIVQSRDQTHEISVFVQSRNSSLGLCHYVTAVPLAASSSIACSPRTLKRQKMHSKNISIQSTNPPIFWSISLKKNLSY